MYKLSSYDAHINEGYSKTIITKKSNKYFKELVPKTGFAKTVEGEMLRAINKIIFRFVHDNEVFYKGNGAESIGPAVSYLINSSKIDAALQDTFATIIQDLDGKNGTKYENGIYDILGLIVSFIENKKGKYEKNNENMFSFESNWEYDN